MTFREHIKHVEFPAAGLSRVPVILEDNQGYALKVCIILLNDATAINTIAMKGCVWSATMFS